MSSSISFESIKSLTKSISSMYKALQDQGLPQEDRDYLFKRLRQLLEKFWAIWEEMEEFERAMYRKIEKEEAQREADLLAIQLAEQLQRGQLSTFEAVAIASIKLN